MFIEAVEEFNLAPTAEGTPDSVYEDAREFLITEMRSSAPTLFGDRFIDTVVQTQSWSTGTARLLFRKMAQDHFDKGSRAVERELNMGNTHLEHVLPRSPGSDPEDPTWLREFFKLESDPDIEIASRIERYVQLTETIETSKTNETKGMS